MARNILVYKHITLDTHEVFYIGIGSKKRSKAKNNNRSIYWNNIVNKHSYYINILKENLTWEEACELEELLILEYGRRDLNTGSLVNLTSGGEGSLGIKVSDETKYKLSIINKGKILTKEHKMKIGLSNKGRKPSNNTKLKQLEKVCKKVIDIETGIIYSSVKEVSKIFNLKYLPLNRKLNGTTKNTTNFKYYNYE